MNKLLIFTNSTSIVNVETTINEDIQNLILLDTPGNSGAFHLENDALTESKNLSDSDLFFLSDELTQQEYDQFYNTKGENDNVYTLYHRKHGNFILNLRTEEDKIKVGQNIIPEAGLYSIVLRVLTDNEGDKCQRIIDRIFKGNRKLEAALDFLHECLSKKPNDLSKLNDHFSEEEIVSVQTLLIEIPEEMPFNISVDKKEKDNIYIDKFVILRDELIKLAGA